MKFNFCNVQNFNLQNFCIVINFNLINANYLIAIK